MNTNPEMSKAAQIQRGKARKQALPQVASAGALRAAKALARPNDNVEAWAQTIDRESGLAECVEALASLLSAVDNDLLPRGDFPGVPSALARAKIALAKLKNPNADTKQAYPAGRWA